MRRAKRTLLVLLAALMLAGGCIELQRILSGDVARTEPDYSPQNGG